MHGSFERQPQSTNTGTRPAVRFPMGDEEDQKIMMKKADSLAELVKEIELAEKQGLKLHKSSQLQSSRSARKPPSKERSSTPPPKTDQSPYQFSPDKDQIRNSRHFKQNVQQEE